MLFGSSDAANAITVDKTPAALWVMDVSVRLFGLSSWSVLVPQALEGVGAVALLYAAVRRAAGPGAALLAGAVFALTPVAALMFRFNNPDALLVLLLVAGAYCVQRACETRRSRWWLVGAGAAVGFGFLAKMLQAFLVLPGFGAGLPGRGRGTTADVGCCGWPGALAAAGGLRRLVPAARRAVARVGAALHRRLAAQQHRRIGLGLQRFRPAHRRRAGWPRQHELRRRLGPAVRQRRWAPDIAWLLPAAVVCLAAGLVLTRRAPRTDPQRAALILWGGWLVVTAVVFSYANGIVHPYYTVALAPAIAACSRDRCNDAVAQPVRRPSRDRDVGHRRSSP